MGAVKWSVPPAGAGPPQGPPRRTERGLEPRWAGRHNSSLRREEVAMRFVFHFGAIVAAVLLVAAEGKKPRTDSHRDALQAVWEPVSGQVAGKPLPKKELADRFEGAPITCDGSKMKLSYSIIYTFENPKLSKKPKLNRVDLNLESTVAPKELDFHDRSEDGSPVVAMCIYSLKDDTLTICWGNEKKRPKEFKTAEGDGFVLVVYKRVESRTERESRPTRPAR